MSGWWSRSHTTLRVSGSDAAAGGGAPVLAPQGVDGEAVVAAVGVDLGHQVEAGAGHEPGDAGGGEATPPDGDAAPGLVGGQEAFGEGDDDVAAAPLPGVDAGQDADAGPPVAAGAGADAQGQAAPPLPGALGQLDDLGDRVVGWPGRGGGPPVDRGHVEVAVGAGRGLLAEVDGGPGAMSTSSPLVAPAMMPRLREPGITWRVAKVDPAAVGPRQALRSHS